MYITAGRRGSRRNSCFTGAHRTWCSRDGGEGADRQLVLVPLPVRRQEQAAHEQAMLSRVARGDGGAAGSPVSKNAPAKPRGPLAATFARSRWAATPLTSPGRRHHHAVPSASPAEPWTRPDPQARRRNMPPKAGQLSRTCWRADRCPRSCRPAGKIMPRRGAAPQACSLSPAVRSRAEDLRVARAAGSSLEAGPR